MSEIESIDISSVVWAANALLEAETPKRAAKIMACAETYFYNLIAGEWVYFFALEDRIKIGYTSDLIQRSKQFRLHTGGAGKFLRIIAGNETSERKIHQELKSEQIKGEWFWLNNKVTSYMEAI